jgi:dihydroorotase/N-acyl-D-amino-acid deacylase
MRDILLANGTLIDGQGSDPSAGDLLIRDDRIHAVGYFDPPPGALAVDCTGLIVCPGFIDAHSHSDLQVLEGRDEKSLQGVTTEVVGNCGFSAYPCGPNVAQLRAFANGIFRGDEQWGWDTAREYLALAGRDSARVNVASLVGHGSLRIAVAGNKLGPLTEREVQELEGRLADALEEGAAGFSTGLMYAPGESAPFDELVRLCRVTARHDKIYTSHIRSYFSGLVDAVDEQIELARRSGCRLQISHMQAVAPRNWHLQAPALERIEKARAEGIDVAFDCYPYVAGSTVLTQMLPQSALEGGTEALLARLADPVARSRIAAETVAAIEWRWSDIYISAVGSDRNTDAVGRNLEELGEQRSRPPIDAALDLLEQERCAVNMICFNQSEDNLKLTLTHPLSIIISDGFYVKGRPHPRLHGTFPKLLGEFCRDRRWLSLPEAIHKVTGAPARRFGLRERGRLMAGFFADIAVFDPLEVNSPATYERPELRPSGIRCVFRSGRLTAGSLGRGRDSGASGPTPPL